MEKEELEVRLKEINSIKVDFIADYNHEMEAIIGEDLQQLLVELYFEGDDFVKRQIQEYCYKRLDEQNKLWEQHKGDYHNIYLLEKSWF